MKRVWALLSVLVLAGVALAAPNPSLVGKPVPSLEFTEFADAAFPENSVEACKGEVVLLVYLRTSCPGCRVMFQPIGKARDRFPQTDVHVVATTNDSRNLFRRYLVFQAEGKLIDFPVAIRSNGNWGVTALPMAYVIGRDGKVAWSGYRDSGFAKAMETAIAAPDPYLPEGWKGARKALANLSKGKYAKALEAARKAKESEESAAAGAYVEKRVVVHLERALAAADRHLGRGDVYSACAALEAAEKSFKGMDLVTRIARKRTEIESREGHADACATWKELASVWAGARKGKSGVKAGIPKLGAILKKATDPKVKAAAKELLEVLTKPWTQKDAATMGGLLENPNGGCGDGS